MDMTWAVRGNTGEAHLSGCSVQDPRSHHPPVSLRGLPPPPSQRAQEGRVRWIDSSMLCPRPLNAAQDSCLKTHCPPV